MPSVWLELMILRSGVTCSTDSQTVAPLSYFYKCKLGKRPQAFVLLLIFCVSKILQNI